MSEIIGNRYHSRPHFKEEKKKAEARMEQKAKGRETKMKERGEMFKKTIALRQ